MLSKMHLGIEKNKNKTKQDKTKQTPKKENHLESWTHWIAPPKKIRIRHLEELGPNAMKVQQVASCHSL
jgi:hypothetical protein